MRIPDPGDLCADRLDCLNMVYEMAGEREVKQL
jgi:hypothetical protein